MDKKMSLEDLGKLMIEHGLVIRAIPREETSVFEVYHKHEYPDAIVYYDEIRKREMIKVTKKLSKGGKFVITKVTGQGTSVNYWGKPVIFYDTIEQAVESFIE